MERIKAIVYGVGKMGKQLTRFMAERGVIIVGAIDVANVGKDLGEVAGLGYPLNVKISDDADAVLGERKADVALVAVTTPLEKMYPIFKRCIENNLNVITTCEESIYPWATSPELAAKLDKLAREHGVTLCGTAYQDNFWIKLATGLTGSSHTIESITVRETFDIDDYGPGIAEYSHVGQTREEFDTWLKGPGFKPWYSRWFIEPVVADLGLTEKKVKQIFEPVIYDVDVQCKSIGKLVKRGEIAGMLEAFEFETEEGILVRGEMIAKLYLPGDTDKMEVYVKGFPELQLVSEKCPIRVATCTNMVNRIPDIINAEPGYVTPEQMPMLKYCAHPLHSYLHQR